MSVGGILAAVVGAVPTQRTLTELREWAGTDQMVTRAADTSIPWAPACILYGFPKEMLFARFVNGVHGYFKADRDLWSLIDDYIGELWWPTSESPEPAQDRAGHVY